MYKLNIYCLLLISLTAFCYSDESILDGTELELTFLVHRHGDRTPIITTLSQSNDPDALIAASAKYGYGQLTDVGKRRGYALGQFIRRRYNELLSPNFNKSEIYIRSTDSTRAKMTVLTAMAAVYPVDQDGWSEDIKWTPVPYTTVPAKYDFNLAIVNCPNLLSGYTSVDDFTEPFPSMEKYSDALNQWSEVVGFNMSEQGLYAYTLNDIYTAQMSLGIPLDPRLEAIYPQIEEVAGIAIDYLFGDEDRGTLLAGVLLNQFFAAADKVIAGEDVPRVQVYSAHDINVFTFQVVTQITPRQGVPKYGSAYALELRKVVATGEYIVVVHRHGDRTPIITTLSQSNDPDALIAASAKYGYGQLTDVGKRRGYALGQFIRRRYNELLSPNFNKSEIYIRSTDSTRAKMTVLTAMAAVYPVDQDGWSEDIKWTPVPYTTVPAKYDFNLAIVNCPNLLSGYTSIDDFTEPFPSMEKYSDALNQWSEVVGFNMSEQGLYAYTLNDIYTAQMSLGIPLDPRLEAIYPQIEEVAGIAIDYLFGDEDRGTLLAGVLLNQFFAAADKVIAGEDVPRVQVYSAHDINVFTFQVVTQITPRQGVPKYGSAYALELRKVVATGEYIVVPVYLNTPSEDVVVYPQIAGCDQRCNIESFRAITAPFNLEEREWRTKCGFSEDMDFDMSAID